MTIRNLNQFRQTLNLVGSDAKAIAELSEFAAFHAREHGNTDPAARLLARVGTVEHKQVNAVAKNDLPRNVRYVKGYLGKVGKLTLKDGTVKIKAGEMPEWQTFADYVAAQGGGSNNSNSYDGRKKLANEVKSLEKKRDEAQQNSNTAIAAAFDKLRAECQAQLDEYDRRVQLVMRNQQEEVAT